jgi:hypothetical protein
VEETKMIFILIFCTILVSSCFADPSIYLQEPRQEGKYYSLSANQPAKVPLEFQLFSLNQPLSQYEFCFSVKSNHFGHYAIQLTCLPAQHNALSMNDLKEDEYTISCYLQEKQHDGSWNPLQPSTLISNVFHVIDYENALPKIELLSVPQVGDITLVADYSKNSADLNLPYTFSNSAFNLQYFTLCLQIHESTTKAEKLKLSCMNANDRQLALNNLSVGKYEIAFILKDLTKQTNNFLPSTQFSRNLVVSPFLDNLPKIHLLNPLQEYVTHPETGKSHIQIVYRLDGFPTAINQVGMCFDLQDTSSGEFMVKNYCLSPKDNQLTLSNMEPKEYLSKMRLIPLKNTNEVLANTEITFPVIVKKPVEFIPSYEWQPLHVWHTIPSGIETR